MVGWWQGRGLPMLRCRKNTVAAAIISLIVGAQYVTATANEINISGTTGQSKVTVVIGEVRPGQEDNYSGVNVAPTQGQGAVPVGQGVPGGQNAPDNGQQGVPEEAERTAMA